MKVRRESLQQGMTFLLKYFVLNFALLFTITVVLDLRETDCGMPQRWSVWAALTSLLMTVWQGFDRYRQRKGPLP